MQTKDLAEILDLVKERDSAGFELLYQHYFRFMFSVAYAVVNSEADAYDVIQSVMMRLYTLDEKLFPNGHALSWLRTVVKNEALMHLRKEKNTLPLEEAPALPVEEQRIEDFVDMDQFRTLTSTLSERQRKVVTMKVLGDMTHREIAKLLSLPIGTVQWLYNTSVKELRRALGALAAAALCFGGGFGYLLYQQLHPTPPGDFSISELPPEAPGISPWLPICGGLCLAALTAFALIYNFSDRFPTKRPDERI